MSQQKNAMERNKKASLIYDSDSQYKIKQKNLNKMRLEADGTDVVIRCCETDYAAHKCILMASSAMFATMFQSSFTEAKLGQVKMDLEPKIMERLLDFIYLDDDAIIEFEDVDDVVKTMKAAHYVQLNALFQICCDKFMKLVSVTDFPLVCSIHQYDWIEKLLGRFIQDHGLVLLRDKIYVGYDAEVFEVFLNEIMKVISSKDVLVPAILEWCKGDTEKEKHALSFISRIDVTELSKSFIKLCIEQDFIKKDQRLYMAYLEQHITALEIDHDFVSLKSVSEEKNFMRSLKLLLFKDNWTPVCHEFSFEANVVNPGGSMFKIPFGLDNLHSCIGVKNDVYIAQKTDLKSCVLKYVLGSDTVKVKSYQSLEHVLIFQKKLFIITKQNQLDFEYVYAERSGRFSYEFHRPPPALSNPFWVAGKDYVFCIGLLGNSNMKAVEAYSFHLHKSDTLKRHEQKCLICPGGFQSHNTVSFENLLYSFVEDKLFVYDYLNDSIVCKKSGITVLADDSVFPIYDYTKSFYVVIRRVVRKNYYGYVYPTGNTEFFLWKVESDSFAARIVVENANVKCEAIIVNS